MQYDKFKDVLFIHVPRAGGQSIQQTMVDSHPGVYANTPGNFLTTYEDGRILEKTNYGNDWKASWKFAVVRNPYAIEVSKWKRRRLALKDVCGRDVTNFTFEHFIDKHITNRSWNIEATNNVTCKDTYPTCSCNFSNTSHTLYVDAGGNTDCRAILSAFNSGTKFKDQSFDNKSLGFARNTGRNGQIPYLTTNTGVIVANTILYFEDLDEEWKTKVATVKGYSNTISYRISNTSSTPDDYREYYKKDGVVNTALVALVANAYELDIDHLHYSWHMGPNTKPTQTWSTTIDTTSYPQFKFGVGASLYSPTQYANKHSIDAHKRLAANTELQANTDLVATALYARDATNTSNAHVNYRT